MRYSLTNRKRNSTNRLDCLKREKESVVDNKNKKKGEYVQSSQRMLKLAECNQRMLLYFVNCIHFVFKINCLFIIQAIKNVLRNFLFYF